MIETTNPGMDEALMGIRPVIDSVRAFVEGECVKWRALDYSTPMVENLALDLTKRLLDLAFKAAGQ